MVGGSGEEDHGDPRGRGVSTFLGSYTYALDEKGRVSLPAPFRREAGDHPFVLLQVYPPALALYPESAWREVEERLRGLLRNDPSARMWMLRITSNAVEVSPDTQGRILIPSKLQEAANLSGQVLMVGAIDKVELWNPPDFAEAAGPVEERFDHYAPQIFR